MRLTNRQALEAQLALGRLAGINLPIRTSFGLAVLSNVIDTQIVAFAKVRDSLIKNYRIRLSTGEKHGSVVFSVMDDTIDDKTKEEKEAALLEFTDKINELMQAYGEDITVKKTPIPSNITMQLETLKPIMDFIEIEGTNAS